MAPHSSALAWKISRTEEPGGLQSMGSLRVGYNWMTWLHFSLSCIGEGNGNPLQCSCLENPRDGGVWWAAACGVAQSQTRLKWLSSSSSCSNKKEKLTLKFTCLSLRSPHVPQGLGAQGMRAAARPSGRRQWGHDKGKINILAISRFEDLSRHLISLGCGVFFLLAF